MFADQPKKIFKACVTVNTNIVLFGLNECHMINNTMIQQLTQHTDTVD